MRTENDVAHQPPSNVLKRIRLLALPAIALYAQVRWQGNKNRVEEGVEAREGRKERQKRGKGEEWERRGRQERASEFKLRPFQFMTSLGWAPSRVTLGSEITHAWPLPRRAPARAPATESTGTGGNACTCSPPCSRCACCCTCRASCRRSDVRRNPPTATPPERGRRNWRRRGRARSAPRRRD